MSNILGTNVSSPIVPFTTADTFPTHCAEYGKGGFRSVATIADRDAIPEDRREIGMFVLVLDDGNGNNKLYIYRGSNTWGEWSSGGGGGERTSIPYEFSTASTTWTIQHGLNLYPSVTTVDSDGYVIIGEVRYTDSNNIVITFSEAVSGKAYINY